MVGVRIQKKGIATPTTRHHVNYTRAENESEFLIIIIIIIIVAGYIHIVNRRGDKVDPTRRVVVAYTWTIFN